VNLGCASQTTATGTTSFPSIQQQLAAAQNTLTAAHAATVAASAALATAPVDPTTRAKLQADFNAASAWEAFASAVVTGLQTAAGVPPTPPITPATQPSSRLKDPWKPVALLMYERPAE